MRPRRRDRKGILAFFLLCAVPFLFLFPYLGAVNNPNENVRTYMTMAVVEHGTFAIDDVVARFGWVNDMARVPKPDGTQRYYSLKGPANSYAGVPVYWVFTKVARLFGRHYPEATASAQVKAAWMRDVTWALRIVTVQIPCFAFLVWLERYLRGFTSDVALRLIAVAATGLGSNYLAYTHMFASHTLFAVAAFMSFGLAEQELARTPGDPLARRSSRAFWAGSFAGLVTMLEYHGLPMSLVLAVFGALVFYRPTRLFAFAAGGLLQAAAMAFFQWRAYGDPLTPGHKLAETQAFASVHHQGIFGITLPTWEAFSALSFDRGFGFFGTSPFMWLGLLAIPFGLILSHGPPSHARRVRVATFVWFLVMAALWITNAGKIYWRAGWTIGPRHLGAAPPFFALGAVCGLEWIARQRPIKRAIVRGVAGGLALASVATIGLIGSLVNTLPESFTRPMMQFAIPMARGGFVPHHVGEWFGWDGISGWYVAAICMFGATALAAVVFSRERTWGHRAIRFAAFALLFAVGIYPALTREPNAPDVTAELKTFIQVWEPPGRDRLSRARLEAERRGPRGPCYWHRLADVERAMNLTADAERDAQRASAPASSCPRSRWTL